MLIVIICVAVACSWLALLDSTKWLASVCALLRAACLVRGAVHDEARPVLVHCSDGWDRTPQITATAQLMMDPYYRTIEVGIKSLSLATPKPGAATLAWNRHIFTSLEAKVS